MGYASKNAQKHNDRISDQEKVYHCAYCKGVVLKTDHYCQYCGKKLRKQSFLAVSLTTSTRSWRRDSPIKEAAFETPFLYFATAIGVVGVSVISSGIAVLIKSLDISSKSSSKESNSTALSRMF